jgi:predicted nucleotidyltransferase
VNKAISIPKDALAKFCRERGIRWLAVFGSALRDDFAPDSDVDLLVEFEPDRIPTLFDIVGMEQELSVLDAAREATGFVRHRLVHAYFDINLDILWQTVKAGLPSLVTD